MHVAGEASLICNKTKLVGSSGHGFRMVATIEGFELIWSGDSRPEWVTSYFVVGQERPARPSMPIQMPGPKG